MTIDLSLSEVPDLVFEFGLQSMINTVVGDFFVASDFAIFPVEGEPTYDVCVMIAKRVVELRQRVNEGARAVFLSSATGNDLEHHGAWQDVPRIELSPDVFESDDSLRSAVHESPQTIGTGSRSRYERAALLADDRIRSVFAENNAPGLLILWWLPKEGVDPGDYAAIDANVVNAMRASVDGFESQLAADFVASNFAVLVPVNVSGTVYYAPGSDPEAIAAEIDQRREDAAPFLYRPGLVLPLDLVFKTLNAEGVERVALTLPAADSPASPGLAYEWGTLTLAYQVATWP